MPRKLIDMRGHRVGRLTVAETVEHKGFQHWRCRCDCGNDVIVRGHDLRKATNISCGCLNSENRRNAGLANKRHGMTGTPEWKAWSAMKDRCLCANNGSYANYGGRGISISPRWVNSFENFLADMGQRPAGMSLDRIDVNGDYTPDNCRWADMSTQSSNQRRFQEPEAFSEWYTAVMEGQRRGRANHSAAQKRRWERWRAERAGLL